MIFWGSKGKVVSGQVVGGISCSNCDSEQFVTFGVLKYFHLYWIPVFPLSKKAGIECTQCKNTLIGKDLPADLSKQIKGKVFTKKNTLPMFSGLIIVVCAVLFLAVAIKQDNAQELAYIEQPVVNDMYIVNLSKMFPDVSSKYKYGLMRIKNVSSEQVEFQISNIAYNKTSGVRKDIREGSASANTYYGADPAYITISQLKDMHESNAIYSIERE